MVPSGFTMSEEIHQGCSRVRVMLIVASEVNNVLKHHKMSEGRTANSE
jgi:hypothetical protein